ncbi:cobyrinate a,c-diamide synthase [Enemella sp. A6]|uniref:cobyrinate a,c-diamide synthase n=1 Tax=Enemella sp. A6 TaxID=3440152 RepID=UPI003EB826C7
MKLPRVVIAAAASGQGKTTVTVGLMAALTRAGHRVAPAKVGPDYIDPGYHALATGRAGRNLDPWLCPEELMLPLLAHGHLTPQPADLSVIEGVMGLYDGRLGSGGFASTAHIATRTESPVVLVIDISAAARTVAAMVHGLAGFDPAIHIAGVILNKSGSQRHTDEVRGAVEAAGHRVLGVLPRAAGVSAPSRHLGLIPVAERDGAVRALDLLAEQTAEHIDLDAIVEIAGRAPAVDVEPWTPPTRVEGPGARPVVALAGGRAFTFRYPETAELLCAQGLDPVEFDPARDRELPAGTAGLYLGGGFPEVYANGLAANTALRTEIREAIAAGLPTVAECAGLLYLCESLDGHDMVGAIEARAAMHPRLRLQYHRAVLGTDSVLGPAGTEVHGHEFHRTRVAPAAGPAPAWLLGDEPEGFTADPAGTGRATMHASYLHTHWAGAPELGVAFAGAVADFAAVQARGAGGGVPKPPTHPPDSARIEQNPALSDRFWYPDPALDSLDHHGDAELGDGLADFAVNVRAAAPPAWLQQAITDSLSNIAAYPDATDARRAIARRHGLPDEMVLPTNGAAEAFTLIARALTPRRPVIVHPQFTEPESALLAAGQVPEHVLTACEDGFVLHAADVPEDADLVLIGNPTNPTGVLHPRAVLDGLRRPGRTLVIDEAFMDAVPGEAETLIARDMAGLIVLRSLTKTWSIAGLRAGYVVADPQLIDKLAGQQPHWSVSAPAAAAMVATAAGSAVGEAAEGATELRRWRDHLVAGLEGLGLRPVPGHAPFVLVRVGERVRPALRHKGFAVRTGASFPGLGADWIRIAVRRPDLTDPLLDALGTTLEELR